MYQIFLIEDDETLQELIRDTLQKYGYRVHTVSSFQKIEEQFERIRPDLVLLDINLPYYDGFYFCRIFRRKSKVPVIFISARDEETHQIMGMEMGADDYITKPFSTQILTAKVNAAIRRCYGEYAVTETKLIAIKGLELIESGFKMTYRGKMCELSKNECRLLKLLLSNADKIVTREELLSQLWDDSAFVDDNTLTVNVTRVKNKLSELGVEDAVKTKRGVGYLFDTSQMAE